MDGIVKEVMFLQPQLRVQFTRIVQQKGSKYFVTIEDKHGRKHAFDMKKEGQEWRVVNAPKVADFILLQEKKLSSLLKQTFS